jgi:thymidylate synthase
MSWLSPQKIVARDLGDAWFFAVDHVLKFGRQWTVERGSYAGQKRWELDWVEIHITHPHQGDLIPEMPPHLSHIPPPTTMEYVHDYLPYLMEDQPLKANEVYTYGQRVKPQMDAIIERYRSGGPGGTQSFGSNQECIAVARPEDIELSDPPCLRQIDTRIVAPDGLKKGEPHQLHFAPYFRSNDLWNGFSANMAAIVLMQQWMAQEIGVEPGEIIYTSKGLHIYQHVWDIAELRVG